MTVRASLLTEDFCFPGYCIHLLNQQIKWLVLILRGSLFTAIPKKSGSGVAYTTACVKPALASQVWRSLGSWGGSAEAREGEATVTC